MVFEISNGKLTVKCDSLGAELCSVNQNGNELLWQGDEKYWHGRAPILFPICGRLWDGKYTYQGKTYEMNLHGFARKNQFELVENTGDSMTLRLIQKPEFYEQYPFKHDFAVKYSLVGTRLDVTYTVSNNDEKEMIFALGAHPGFNVPFDGGKFEDYSIVFGEKKNVLSSVLSPRKFMTRATEPFPLDGGTTLKLKHSLFDNDALVLSNTAHEARLTNGKKSIKVSFPEEFRFLGIWHQPETDAPFVCIEPWTSCPAYDGEIDDLETKASMTRLAPGKSYSLTYSIEVQ